MDVVQDTLVITSLRPEHGSDASVVVGDGIVAADGVPVLASNNSKAVDDVLSGRLNAAMIPVLEDGQLTGFVKVEFVQPNDVTVRSQRSADDVKAARLTLEKERFAKAKAISEGLIGEEYEVTFLRDPLGVVFGGLESGPTVVEAVVTGSTGEKKDVKKGDTLLSINRRDTSALSWKGEGPCLPHCAVLNVPRGQSSRLHERVHSSVTVDV